MIYNVGTIGRRAGPLATISNYLRGVSLARQAINQKIPQVLDRANGVVIDIGGSGDLNRFVPERWYVRLDKNPYPSNTITADACVTPFRCNSVSRVLCISVLEHSDSPRQLIKEIFRILQPGGILFLSVPWMFESHMEPHDYWRFSYWQMARWLEEENFDIQYAEPVNGRAGLIAHILQGRRWSRWSIGLAAAAVHVNARISDFRYTTQLNFALQKPSDGLACHSVEHWSNALVCVGCGNDEGAMYFAEDKIICECCGHEVSKDLRGGFIYGDEIDLDRVAEKESPNE